MRGNNMISFILEKQYPIAIVHNAIVNIFVHFSCAWGVIGHAVWSGKADFISKVVVIEGGFWKQGCAELTKDKGLSP